MYNTVQYLPKPESAIFVRNLPGSRLVACHTIPYLAAYDATHIILLVCHAFPPH